MKRFMRLLFVLSVLLHQSHLSAAISAKQTIEKYKESMAKIRTIVHQQKTAERKRDILKQVISGVNKKLEKENTSKLKLEEKKTFDKLQKMFSGWNKELPTIADKDLDDYADTVVQETEQASVVGIVVAIVILVILIVVLAVVCAATGADCSTRYHYHHRYRCCW